MAVGTVADALLVHYGCVPVLRLRHSVLELRVTRSGGRVPGEFQISHFSSASHISISATSISATYTVQKAPRVVVSLVRRGVEADLVGWSGLAFGYLAACPSIHTSLHGKTW